MPLGNYHRFDAVGLASLVAAHEVSPAEIAESAFRAISAVNPGLNALVEIYQESAYRQIEAGLPQGPLRGVPVVLKDLGCPAAGTRTTFGSELFSGAPLWGHDSLLVERLKRAGAVIVGRSNTCEFGISLITEPRFYGPTQNPYKHGHTPGGSSGGSASAVAAGLIPLAHATDGCGSIRVPASHCGLFGLKPTRGRTSLWPDAGEGWAGMSAYGCLSRTVRDTAVFMDAVSGPHPGDPHVAPLAQHPFIDEASLPCPQLKIGVLVNDPHLQVAQECQDALCAATKLLEELGHQVEHVGVQTDFDETITHLIPIWAAQLWGLVEPRYAALGLKPNGWGMEPVSWQLALKAKELTADDYARSVRFLHAQGRKYAALMQGLDVVVTPVTARAPWPIGQISAGEGDLRKVLTTLFDYCPFTVQFNMTGQPAMSVPMHWTADGLPIGVQFAGHFGAEALLLRLASQLEAARPWHERILAARAVSFAENSFRFV